MTLLWPGVDSEAVFDVLAAMDGGGAVLLGPADSEPESRDLNGADLVVFTSGTTGRPKGVRLTRSNIEAACEASVSHLGHGPADVWLVAMPLHHVGGLSAVVRSVFAGGAVRLLERFDAAAFSEAMKGDATVVSVVPTMLHRILDLDSGPYEGLRAVLVGGGPIPAGLLERAVDAGMPVLPSYGMTETFGQAATLRPGATVARRAHPLPGMEMRVGSDGRISLRSPQVSPGYLGEPDRRDQWFVTNDLGVVDDEGAVSVLGRADIVLITGGENVNPERVEAELLEHADVSEAVVVGVDDDVWGQKVVAIYAGEATEAELSALLRERLPRHMIPKQWNRLRAVPRTGTGKLDRQTARRIASSLS